VMNQEIFLMTSLYSFSHTEIVKKNSYYFT